MINFQQVMVAGSVNSAPRFALTKDGRKYCAFSLGVVDSSVSLSSNWTNFSVFMFEGKQYELLKQGKVGIGDNIMVTGRFQVKRSPNKASMNINVFCSDLIIMASSYANSFPKEQYEGNEHIDVEQSHNEMQKPQQSSKTYNQDDFDWGD